MTCLGAVAHTLPLLFPTIQLGVGVRGGVEIATHTAQLALEAGGDDVVAMRLDLRNAFNERARHVIAEALLACPTTAPVWRFFVAAYGDPGHVGVYERGRLIRSFLATDGVRQGCPIAAFLFALSVQYLYEASVKRWPAVFAVAIADDLTFVGPAADVLGAFADLRTLCSEHGPALNLGKCTALWPRDTAHPAYGPFVDEVRRLGVRLRHDCIEMLGATLGLNAARSAACLATLAHHNHFFRRLRHSDLPAQVAMLLLRQSGVPRLTYLARITPPSLFRATAEQFDEQVLRVAALKAGLAQPATTNDTMRIVTTPLRLGGLGLTPHTAISPAAWWASLALAAPHLRTSRTAALPLTPEEMDDRVMGTATRAAMVDTYALLTRHGAVASRKAHAHAMPAGLSDFWRFYGDGAAHVKPHLQRHLSRAIADARYLREDGMLAPMRVVEVKEDDANDDPRVRSTTSDWLLARPSTGTFLSTRAYHSAIRHRYRLPARPGLPELCECGDRLEPQHWHWCGRTGSAIIRRHDLVKKALVLQAKRAGLIVQEEPELSIKGGRTRCDLVFYSQGTAVYVDVMICCPWAPSHLRQGDGGVVACEKVKISKWRETCVAHEATFKPFVMSSIGEMGDEARSCIALMAVEHAANAPVPDSRITATITTAACVALQVGNGIVDDQGTAFPSCHPAAYIPPTPPPFAHSALYLTPIPPWWFLLWSSRAKASVPSMLHPLPLLPLAKRLASHCTRLRASLLCCRPTSRLALPRLLPHPRSRHPPPRAANA